MHWGVELQLHAFLTMALHGSEWSAIKQKNMKAVDIKFLEALKGKLEVTELQIKCLMKLEFNIC